MKGTQSGSKKRGRDKVAVGGDWFAVPVAFLASRACAELSPMATKMLVGFLGQLRSNHFGNGRMDACKATLRRLGWTSDASAQAAIKELISAGLLAVTRRGCKGTVGLFGLTLFPMHCQSKGLDVGPGAWTVATWREEPGVVDPPTDDAPAVWNRPRAAEKKREHCSRHGNESPRCIPAAGTNAPADPRCIPAAGAHSGRSAGNALPLREPPLRRAICTRKRAGSGRLWFLLARRARAYRNTARLAAIASRRSGNVATPRNQPLEPEEAGRVQ